MRGSTDSLQYYIVTVIYNVILNVILYYTGLSCEGIYRIFTVAIYNVIINVILYRPVV